MERKQFTFYRSFYDAVKVMQSDAEKLALLMAIIEYALLEKEPELSEHLLVAFTLVKPTLDTAREKSRWGSKNKKLEQGDSSSSSYSSEDDENKNYSYSKSKKENKSKKEIEKEKESKSKSNSLADRPTTEEIFDFFHKMKLNGDPQKFIDYNDANGWQLKNWQAAAVGWSLKEKQYGTGGSGQTEGGTRLPEGLDPDSLPRGGIFDVI